MLGSMGKLIPSRGSSAFANVKWNTGAGLGAEQRALLI